ncbi:MAG TPA: hypothetical protein VIX85_08005 [Acidimicrobiales bacterium]|jgi:hypothetical protein
MVELVEGDVRALQAFDAVLAAVDQPGSLGPAALGLIATLVPCDCATYSEIDARRRRAVAGVTPCDAVDSDQDTR